MSKQRDPIAIVGAACRFPDSPSIRSFWELLVSGHDAVTEIPSHRISTSPWHDTESPFLDRDSIRVGGFLAGIDQFDAGFFGISADEAVRIDPQHRMLLESAWEALEDAGIPAESIAGTQTGVYSGCFQSGYWDLLRAAGVLDTYSIFSSGPWQSPAGHISYQLDLRGPSMGIEATCATSLLAVHLACRALWEGEIPLALVGSASVIVDPAVHGILDRNGVLSPSGHVRFAAADSDGTVRGEGVATVVLKPLRQAIADGNQVYATIIGTAAGHSGRTGKWRFAPGAESQEQLLRSAYQDAGVPPAEVGYVEAHGTGTLAGDPIELTALANVLGSRQLSAEPCFVGSVKSNIGHCEGTAGLAGLLKAALAVHHGTIPATLQISRPHPVLRESGGALALPRTAVEWPLRGRRRTAGVSGAGAAGPLVHVVLAQAPASSHQPRTDRRMRQAPCLLPLSARDPGALRRLAADYAGMLRDPEKNTDLADVCFSAGAHRSHHNFRLALVGSSRETMAEDLSAYAVDDQRDAVITGENRLGRPPHVVFVFPGQSPTWDESCRDLLSGYPSFARRMGDCDRAIARELGWRPSERLAKGAPPRSVAEIHPMQWAIEVSLAAMWEEWGIKPDYVVGHSVGEIAAAAVAGALDLRDAAAVVCRRSRLLTTLADVGALWSVRLDEAGVRSVIGEDADRVSVCAVNSPSSVAISGETGRVEAVIGRLRERGVSCRHVAAVPSHVPQVERILPRLAEQLRQITPHRGRVPIYSTAWNAPVKGTELDGDYWIDHLRSPVRFESAIRTMLGFAAETVFIEIGPRPLLLWSLHDIIDDSSAAAQVISPMRPDRLGVESMLAGLGSAYTAGCIPGWRKVIPDGRFVRVPTYSWTKRGFWIGRQHGFSAAHEEPPGVKAASAWAERRRRAAALQSGDQFQKYVLRTISEVLGMTSEIDAVATLREIGMDSLHALRLREKMHAELGLRIPLGQLAGSRTIAELSAGWRQDLLAIATPD